MLALMIFCLVAVALTTALYRTVDASILLRDESQVRLEMQNLLIETAAQKLKPGKSEVQVGDGRVHYERDVRAVQAKTAAGVLLPNLYEISVRASWRASGQDRSNHAEVIRLQAMSQMSCSAQRLQKAKWASQRVKTSGYLLLEVLLAVAVLSISVVMIFRIIQTTLKATADITFLQTQQRKVDGISQLLRRNFESMPQTCTFQTRSVNGSLELIFRSAPFNFSWVTSKANFGTVVIARRSLPNGRLALSVLQESGDALNSYVDGSNEKKGEWFPLVDDVEQLSWRFFDGQAEKWTSDWPNPATKPSLVELTFKLAGRNHLERCVFRWPMAQTGS